MAESGHREQRLKERPRGTKESLLVADLQIAKNQHPEKVAVANELSKIRERQTCHRSNEGDVPRNPGRRVRQSRRFNLPAHGEVNIAPSSSWSLDNGSSRNRSSFSLIR